MSLRLRHWPIQSSEVLRGLHCNGHAPLGLEPTHNSVDIVQVVLSLKSLLVKLIDVLLVTLDLVLHFDSEVLDGRLRAVRPLLTVLRKLRWALSRSLVLAPGIQLFLADFELLLIIDKLARNFIIFLDRKLQLGVQLLHLVVFAEHHCFDHVLLGVERLLGEVNLLLLAVHPFFAQIQFVFFFVFVSVVGLELLQQQHVERLHHSLHCHC